ncbi:MAG: 4'-phosphopantetheinyl transferase superfamily protein [Nannocystis sp.]|nr:4'-phosphopantetheinyl transferase superfamily protein [Nannocystis sp.]
MIPELPSSLVVDEDRVDLWWIDPREIRDPEALERLAAWLSADEVARRGRFVFERHRHDFLIARALVRGVLARYTGIEPAGLRFSAGPHGRPALAPGCAGAAAGLRFNLSHTEGRAVLAVACDEIGVDVEASARKGEPAKIAERFFAPAEVAALRGLVDEAAQRERFFAYWTLKEAYIKGVGVGVGLGLDNFWFDLGRADPTDVSAAPAGADGWSTIAATGDQIRFAPGFADDPSAWFFTKMSLGSGFPGAIAARRPGRAAPTVRARAAALGRRGLG